MSNPSDKPGSGSAGSLAGTETPQTAVWKSDFGREYSDRNTFDTEALDRLYRTNYGVLRTDINENSLRGIEKTASFLEVGCNTGNQLVLLRQMGYSNLSGVELQPYALEIARRRLPGVSLKAGSALTLPHGASSFDVVFT